MLFAGGPACAGGEVGVLGRVGVNTTLAGAAAVFLSLSITRWRFGKPDASLAANGWVAGLVACSAGCPFFPPAAAVLVGAVAGALVAVAVPWFESKLYIHDPGGAIAVHGLGGLWGVLAVGYLAKFPASVGQATDLRQPTDQWLAQMIGVASVVGFVLPLSYGLNRLLNIVCPQRVPMEAECIRNGFIRIGRKRLPGVHDSQ
ncbi:MAG: hypothetical protein DMG21_00050 [Acidobacteria bacterium]|nr:MAG: hypothetical protein DMG21_00050 [Acidobacteriota bacterium]